ncbi:hypothetical protein BUALT_Bualt01G0180300 [Buddleja alternifolia]|uniref:Transposase-associated domain-containing protein n=1 Tax=Buddleja alternifolia TaxID=168488 RepID=A0AAV6YEJ7_9LAMI|nr:hypothetical protein BUALT_Bualt01G0180300 [Buddleja alternifolia]
MDKSWMNLPRTSIVYGVGLQKFLDFAFTNSSIKGLILCPCIKCKNGICRTKEVVKEHLICDGFIKGYTQWLAHGEHEFVNTPSTETPSTINASDDMQGLLHDVFGRQNDDYPMGDPEEVTDEGHNTEAETFFKLIDDSQQELYPSCKKFSKLSFLIRMLHIKCLVETRFNQIRRNDTVSESPKEGIDVFSVSGRPIGKMNTVRLDDKTLSQAHRYVLFNCKDIEPYVMEHKTMVNSQNPCASEHEIHRIHVETFASWLKDQVGGMQLVENDAIYTDLKLLAKGPIMVGKQFSVARDHYDMEERSDLDMEQWGTVHSSRENEEVVLVRDDVVGTKVDMPMVKILETQNLRRTYGLPDVNQQEVVSVHHQESPRSDGSLSNLAKIGMYCPIDILDWRKIPKSNKKKLLEIVQSKFIGIHGMDEWILQSIGEKWRHWKRRLKDKYFKPDMPFEYLVKNTDERVIEEQWKGLLTFWLSEEGKVE